jgi:hypothetical protein
LIWLISSAKQLTRSISKNTASGKKCSGVFYQYKNKCSQTIVVKSLS